jgi:hypothetical protein
MECPSRRTFGHGSQCSNRWSERTNTLFSISLSRTLLSPQTTKHLPYTDLVLFEIFFDSSLMTISFQLSIRVLVPTWKAERMAEMLFHREARAETNEGIQLFHPPITLVIQLSFWSSQISFVRKARIRMTRPFIIPRHVLFEWYLIIHHPCSIAVDVTGSQFNVNFSHRDWWSESEREQWVHKSEIVRHWLLIAHMNDSLFHLQRIVWVGTFTVWPMMSIVMNPAIQMRSELSIRSNTVISNRCDIIYDKIYESHYSVPQKTS